MFSSMVKRKKMLFLLFLAAYVVLAILSASVGTAKIAPFDVLRVIMKSMPFIRGHIGVDVPQAHHLIVWVVRLPRILMASLVGMGLAVVGASFQSLFRNPLADPHVLGISSGAALGAAIAMVIRLPVPFASLSLVTVLAFIGAASTALLVYFSARTGGKVSTTNLLLAGVSVSFFMSALISIIMVFNRQEASKIIFWMMGSFNTSSWRNVTITAPVVLAGILFTTLFYRDFNLMFIGEDTAKNLGVNTERTKKFIVFLSSLITAVCVSFAGIIGFVGFLVPHLIRMLFGPNNKLLIPFSALLGAIFLLASDTVARTLAAPGELPVGAVTALIGSPYFIWLLLKIKKKGA